MSEPYPMCPRCGWPIDALNGEGVCSACEDLLGAEAPLSYDGGEW